MRTRHLTLVPFRLIAIQTAQNSYTFMIAKYYAHVTNTQFGLLSSILPALALIAKPVSCSLADAMGVHKQFLIGSLATFGISYGSLGFVAMVKDPNSTDHDFAYWLIMCVMMGLGYVSMSCVYCMNDALASNYARKNNMSYSKMRLCSTVGWASGALVVMFIGDVDWLPFRIPGIILMSIAIAIDILFLVFWPYDEDFEMFHDGSTVDQRKLSIVGPNTMAYLAQNQHRNSISRDMLERIKTGRSKSVGNLPRINGGELTPRQHFDLTKTAKPTETKKEEEKEYTNFQCQMLLIKMIASAHKSFIRYVILFVLFGMVNGIVLAFQFDYFKAKISKNNHEAEIMTNLSIIMQSVGELPIFFFAYDLIKLFGSNACLSLSLVTLGLRCFVYGRLLPYLGAYWVGVAEAMHGPSYGLYWVLIVDIGSNYALMVSEFMPELKKRGIVKDRAREEELNGCLRATMIGVMSSSMEGLGTALGSLLGGFISSSLGYYFMWDLCAMLGIVAGFINIGWDVITKLLIKREGKKNRSKSSVSIVVEDVDRDSRL
jgi:MFS family permease